MNAKLLEQQISRYVKQEITKKELGVWAMAVYQDLMKGEYIEIEKLVIYHFIRAISSFHRIPDNMADEYPCSEKEILDISEILQGKKDICYTFRIRICEFIYKKEEYKNRLRQFEILRNLIDEFCIQEKSSYILERLIEYSSQESKGETLIDLLEMHIKGIIMENYDQEEHLLDYRQSVGIYTRGSDINKETFACDIKKILECVMGKKDFRVSIIYKQGASDVMLIL